MWEKQLKKKVRKGPASLLKISLWGSSVSACANEAAGFSVSGASTPNGLFQVIKKISELLQTAPLTILNFLLTIKISYFSFSHTWKIRDLTWHERRIHPTLTSISVLAFLPLLQLLECLNGYMCGHNLTMKLPPDFHNYTGLKGLVNSFS